MPTPSEDLQARLGPSDEQVAIAQAMLAEAATWPGTSEVDAVIVALALPGKTHGIWVTGQPVEPVPGGFWLANTHAWEGPYSYSHARAQAAASAELQLGEREGTPAHAVIHRGHELVPAVFEDFRTGPYRSEP